MKKATSKRAAKAPSTKRPAAKKKPAKKKAPEVMIEDPSDFSPIIHKKRVDNTMEARQSLLTKMTLNVRKSVAILSERSSKRPVKLLTPAMLRRAITPYDEIYFQHMIGSIGFRTPVAIEIIAQEKVGATTFVMDMISRLLDLGCYVVYCECEGKPMDDKRIKRLMDTDPKVATLKMNAVEWAEARTLSQFDDTLRKTVGDLRKRCDADPRTKGNPIFFIGDPWGALMSKGEAKGNTTWGMSPDDKKEAPKDTTDGSNFEHAKHAQGMARWLPSFMEQHNCSVIFVNKQNDKIDMNAKPGYGQPSPMKNDTRVGGRALKRLCAYRITMMQMGEDLREKDGLKRAYGHNIRMMAVANSYGPKGRICEATVLFDCHDDAPGYQAPGFTYDPKTSAWLSERKFLGVTVDKGLYTCDLVGCVAVPPSKLMQTLRSYPEHLEYVGSVLGIEGYAPLAPTSVVVTASDETDDVPVDEDGELLVPGDDGEDDILED